MHRDILNDLEEWKASSHRKPLMLKGARQVGKTWSLKEFGARSYQNVAYFSLERIDRDTPSEWAEFFQTTRDPHRIVANLSLASGFVIRPKTTLLILDEIQDCPAAIGALKAFCEDAPEYHVATAGSLLGVALSRDKGSFPVGKVTFMDMQPLTFSEFLRADGASNLADWCQDVHASEGVPSMISARLAEELQRYFVVGGMPEAVKRWSETSDVGQVDRVLADLLDSYDRDFAKHGGVAMYAKLSRVWRSLPTHLARENKKFVYGQVREGARAREYEDAIEWLASAGLVRKVVRSKAPSIPLSSNDDEAAFKLYCLDVGLLRAMAHLPATAFGRTDELFSQFKGGFAESYVAQTLAGQFAAPVRYWTNAKPRHEVDFIVQAGEQVVPIEVKSGENVRASSLRYYGRKYPEATPLRVRCSLLGLRQDNDMLNVPLYLADHMARLIGER
ncbi:MAG: DUF4143 domain-containing protein [Coriobacteriales bacterium]|nr:DUF4143 domain-containing protein [Coriobacteriales bacterium]